MPGQPDWQRYQTSAGPLIYTSSHNANNNFSPIYVGSWRSLFFYCSINDPAALIRLNCNWFEDAAELQGVVANYIVLGNNTDYIQQVPVLARYLSLSTDVLIGGTTNEVSMWIAPSLLDSFPYKHIVQDPIISLVNQNIGAGATVSFKPIRLGGGRKKLVIWPANASMRTNIRYFGTDGALDYLAVLSHPTAAVQSEFEFNAPEAPYSIDITNLAASAAVVHVFLYHFD